MFANLVDLLAGNAPVITQFSNHLFSHDLITHALHSNCNNAQNPLEKATQLIDAVLATLKCYPNPISEFTSFITVLCDIGLCKMATKLSETFGKRLILCCHCFLILLESKGGSSVALQQINSQLSAKPSNPQYSPQAEPHPQVPQDAELQIENRVIQLNSEAEVVSNIEKLYNQFTSLVVAMRLSLENLITSGKVTVVEVALHASTYLNQQISNGSSEEMFKDIKVHYDFINFAIVKSLVNEYFPEDRKLKPKLSQYIDSISEFLKYSQLKHILSAIKKKLSHLPVSPSTSDQTKPVIIKLNEVWDDMTLENLKKVLQYYFKEVADLFSLISITTGCIIITLLIPTTQTQYLIDTIRTKKSSMNRLGIMEIAVDNKTIPIRRKGDNNFDISLHQSVKVGDSFEVSVLLQLGANPNSKDEEGKYPVELAIEHGHNKAMQTLLAIESKLKDD